MFQHGDVKAKGASGILRVGSNGSLAKSIRPYNGRDRNKLGTYIHTDIINNIYLSNTWRNCSSHIWRISVWWGASDIYAPSQNDITLRR